MLAIDPSLPHGNFREILLYRKSMRKFDSTHRVLEICETSKPSEYFNLLLVIVTDLLLKTLLPPRRKVSKTLLFWSANNFNCCASPKPKNRLRFW